MTEIPTPKPAGATRVELTCLTTIDSTLDYNFLSINPSARICILPGLPPLIFFAPKSIPSSVEGRLRVRLFVLGFSRGIALNIEQQNEDFLIGLSNPDREERARSILDLVEKGLVAGEGRFLELHMGV